MNRYHVRIDGEESPERYTYEELLEMGVLDFEDIHIRNNSNSAWESAKYYNFPEKKSSIAVSVDSYGQIVNKENKTGTKIRVDEYGQIISSDSSNNNSSRPTTSSSNTSRSSDYRHISGIDWNDVLFILKIIGWIIFLSVVLAIVFSI